MSTEQDAANDTNQQPRILDGIQPLPSVDHPISGQSFPSADNPFFAMRRSNQRITSGRLLIAFCALVVIIGGICLSAFFTYQNIQQNNANATAIAQVDATGTVLGNRATATKEAKVIATAISNVTATAAMQYLETVTATAPDPHNPYPPNTGYLTYSNSLLGFDVNLPDNEHCAAAKHGYQISVSPDRIQYCRTYNSFSNFAMEVNMTIEQGNCGGLQFRTHPATSDFYLFQVCADTSFYVYACHGPNVNDFSRLKFSASDAIAFGHGQKNTIAVVAMNSQLDFYVNHNLVDHENDASITEGYVGLFATGYQDATEVTYTDEHIWKL